VRKSLKRKEMSRREMKIESPKLKVESRKKRKEGFNAEAAENPEVAEVRAWPTRRQWRRRMGRGKLLPPTPPPPGFF
jgi:hypothetical protein